MGDDDEEVERDAQADDDEEVERDAQADDDEEVEQVAQADDDEEAEQVLEVRPQLSHDDDEDAHEDAQVDPVTFWNDFSALLWPKSQENGRNRMVPITGRIVHLYPSQVIALRTNFYSVKYTRVE